MCEIADGDERHADGLRVAQDEQTAARWCGSRARTDLTRVLIEGSGSGRSRRRVLVFDSTGRDISGHAVEVDRRVVAMTRQPFPTPDSGRQHRDAQLLACLRYAVGFAVIVIGKYCFEPSTRSSLSVRGATFSVTRLTM